MLEEVIVLVSNIEELKSASNGRERLLAGHVKRNWPTPNRIQNRFSNSAKYKRLDKSYTLCQGNLDKD